MTFVHLQGGPAAGRSFHYADPLPDVLVICDTADGYVYHDYRRISPRGTGYRFVDPTPPTPPETGGGV